MPPAASRSWKTSRVVLKAEVAVGSRTSSSLWVRVEQEAELVEVELWFISGFI